ncbi:MAG: hypothetical protein GEU82_07870 [Luteitalea sp.]|nr:hypothetical protein [Luteitalea sp.]
MQNLPFAVGDGVRVRRQRWRVVSIRPYEDCCLVALTGIGSRNRNVETRVLLPFDVTEPVGSSARMLFVGSRRWRQECRRVVATHGGADALHAARVASMDLLPHQLEPALAIVRGATSRILIADDVGLGKTIQAGLIASELIRRGAAERILVLTPAGLREQWIGELAERFGLPFRLADTAAMQQQRAIIRPGLNPWSTMPLIVTSLDYIKRPEVLPAVEGCRWDLVIVDEAHAAVTAVERHGAVSRLAARSPYVLLLTATPHNGDADAFASLCAVGGHHDTLLVFRRTRHDIGLPSNRRVRRLVVKPTAEEQELHIRLERFTRAALADHPDRARDVWLALSTIHKRALSSAFAVHETVRRRLLSLGGHDEPSEQQLRLPLADESGEHDDEDRTPRWTCPSLDDPSTERTLLTEIADAAAAAFGGQSKLRALARLVRRIGEPVVIFTEYRDTLLHVRERVFPDAAFIHGGLSRAERRAALDAFERGDRPVLLATDAAAKG